ncbi:MAG: hypothetical protein RL534_531, partial [Actinomycetota bacterium]
MREAGFSFDSVAHMADSSFDIVSKIDRAELDNAVNQASR